MRVSSLFEFDNKRESTVWKFWITVDFLRYRLEVIQL